MSKVKVNEAIYEVQKKLEAISVDSEQTGGRSTWNYASFLAISEALKPLLIANNLKVTHSQNQGIHIDDVPFDQDGAVTPTFFTLTTDVEHMPSGQSVSEDFRVQLQDPTNSQEIGGKITYGKRYNLNCLFNLVFDKDPEDTDGETPPVEATPEQIAEGIKAEDALTLSQLIGELNLCDTRAELNATYKVNKETHQKMGKLFQLVYRKTIDHMSENRPKVKKEVKVSAA
tara:strand:+ start:117 stop:803 length:687 start_codon:yes stop_codon:yes gene_type:complete